MCSTRSTMVRNTSKVICYGCGGAHVKSACTFRPNDDRPFVPTDRKRCFGCMLPQHAILGVSFHSNESQLSGSQSSQKSCQVKGDKVFALLSAFYFAKTTIQDTFLEAHGEKICGMPPVQPTTRTDGFQQYWNWLWLPTAVGFGIANLDIVLSFMLNETMNPL